MNHSENKINWCLKKAKKEIEKGEKHRGLIKTEPNIKNAKRHIEKAEHNISAIIYFNKGGFSDWSISAVFYSIYHCFLAIASKFGYESRNQECTLTLIKSLKEKKEIDLENIFIETLENHDEKERHETSIIEKREFYTYGTTVSTGDDEEIEKNINLCRDCLDQTKKIIFN